MRARRHGASAQRSHTHAAAAESGAPQRVPRTPWLPLQRPHGSRAPHKHAPQPAPGCAAHKDTAPRASPVGPPVHMEGFAAPHNALHTPGFSAGPALVTYSTVTPDCVVHGTHTPNHNLILTLCGTPGTRKALQLRLHHRLRTRTRSPCARGGCRHPPAGAPMPWLRARMARAAACCRLHACVSNHASLCPSPLQVVIADAPRP